MNSKPEGAGARACWFVGATYGGTDNQTPRFLQEGIWENGYQDKYLDAVKSIQLRPASVVYAIGLIIVLDIFGVNTNSIIALLGAAGLAVGLALKDTLCNIAAGIMLLILRQFRVGHFIECGVYTGTVKEIGLFTTILETIDGLYLSMPNSSLWGTPIKNFTRNGKRRMDLVVGISYGDSIDKGFEVLKEIVEAESRFLKDPGPQVMVQALGDSSVNLQQNY